MSIIRKFTESDKNAWDNYVHNHPQATHYHLSGWKNVIENTYGHNSYYLMALRPKPGASGRSSDPTNNGNSKIKHLGCREAEKLGNREQLKVKGELSTGLSTFNSQTEVVAGILPLVHLKHFLFGNSLISIPFFDYGGILADDQETEKKLIYESLKLGRNIGAEVIELRNVGPLKFLNVESCNESKLNFEMRSHKVRMMLGLPDTSDELIKSFKSKLRSQIRKPTKEGLTAAVGGVELLDDFYTVFAQNMRDLGSPVHSKRLIESVINIYPKQSRIVVIYQDRRPLACSFVVGFKNILENPWASSLRKYSKLAPNMLLYWKMLEYACDMGFSSFDFGRSTPHEGTFKFKSQWGAEPIPLHWYYIATNGNKFTNSISESQTYGKAVEFWKKLPVPVTKIVGPPIRKYIGL